MRALVLGLVICVLAATAVPPVSGDGTFVYPEDFFMMEPGQNAIIAWNGCEETLVLSVDIFALKRAPGGQNEGTQTYGNDIDFKAVHMVPFPSVPDFELFSAEKFEGITEFMYPPAGYRGEGRPYWYYGNEGGPAYPSGGPSDGTGGEIIVYENVGPHEITIVRVTNATEFAEWANEFFKMHELKNSWNGEVMKLPEGTDAIVEYYLDKNCPYFMFDIIDVDSYAVTVDPIAFTFETQKLFFPLTISSLMGGESIVDLALITPADIMLDYRPLSKLRFRIVSSNYIEHDAFNEYDADLCELFSGDVILDRFRSYMYMVFDNGDIELNMVQTIWQRTETDYIFRPLTGDLNADGRSELMYFTPRGVTMLNTLSGNEIWHCRTEGYANYNEIAYIDLNGDGVNEIVFYDAKYTYAVDPVSGETVYRTCPQVTDEQTTSETPDGRTTIGLYGKDYADRYGSMIGKWKCLEKNEPGSADDMNEVLKVPNSDVQNLLLPAPPGSGHNGIDRIDWEYDIGVPVYQLMYLQLDADEQYEAVIVMENKVIGLDVPVRSEGLVLDPPEEVKSSDGGENDRDQALPPASEQPSADMPPKVADELDEKSTTQSEQEHPKNTDVDGNDAVLDEKSADHDTPPLVPPGEVKHREYNYRYYVKLFEFDSNGNHYTVYENGLVVIRGPDGEIARLEASKITRSEETVGSCNVSIILLSAMAILLVTLIFIKLSKRTVKPGKPDKRSCSIDHTAVLTGPYPVFNRRSQRPLP